MRQKDVLPRHRHEHWACYICLCGAEISACAFAVLLFAERRRDLLCKREGLSTQGETKLTLKRKSPSSEHGYADNEAFRFCRRRSRGRSAIDCVAAFTIRKSRRALASGACLCVLSSPNLSISNCVDYRTSFTPSALFAHSTRRYNNSLVTCRQVV